jgi:hypothetical protein
MYLQKSLCAYRLDKQHTVCNTRENNAYPYALICVQEYTYIYVSTCDYLVIGNLEGKIGMLYDVCCLLIQ